MSWRAQGTGAVARPPSYARAKRSRHCRPRLYNRWRFDGLRGPADDRKLGATVPGKGSYQATSPAPVAV
jgi:hypothetical protein